MKNNLKQLRSTNLQIQQNHYLITHMFLTLLLPIVVYAQQSTLVDALETTSKAKYIIGIIGTILIIVSVFIAISFCRKGRSQRHQTGGYGPDLFAIGSDTVDMANESGSYQNY